MWIGRREFEEFKRESMMDRRELHGAIREAADEIKALRNDLRIIARLGAVLVSTVGLLGPTIIGIIALLRHP